MKKTFRALLAASAVAAGNAVAAVPEGITTAITTAGTDANTVAGAVLIVIVGIFAIKLMRRAL